MIIKDWINEHSDELIRLSETIWGYAEIALTEEKSSALLADFLEKNDFKIEKNIAGMPTAFRAEWGESGPRIAFLGEYDALPGLSQKTVPYQEKTGTTESGHGCGHNLLGVGSLGAALALKNAVEKGELEARIYYFGCPAEETMTGKILMEADGAFDQLDAAFSWHPSTDNMVMENDFLAMKTLEYSFDGVSAHAAAAPEKGRSALDAVELMNVGVNYLREHITDDVRIHYTISDAGGAPNIVPPKAKSLYYVRARKWRTVVEVVERINDIARGAAMMSGTSCNIVNLTDCKQTLHNPSMEKILHECMSNTGAQEWSESDLEFAEEIGKTLGKSSERGGKENGSLNNDVLPVSDNRPLYPASTDVANVSWKVPTAQIWACCIPYGVPAHTWQFTASVGMSIGQRGMLYASEVLAKAALKILEDQDLQKQIKEDFQTELENQR